MGRYYNGDIEGKFLFAIQSSNAPERFGAYQIENKVEYMIDDLEIAEKALKIIIENIGEESLKKLNSFFKNRKSYNDEDLDENNLLAVWGVYKEEYADYLLGKKIIDKIKEQGYCNIIVDI